MREIARELIAKWVVPYAKAWAAGGGIVFFSVLADWGLEVPEEVSTAFIAGVTAFLVWFLPNIPFVKKS